MALRSNVNRAWTVTAFCINVFVLFFFAVPRALRLNVHNVWMVTAFAALQRYPPPHMACMYPPPLLKMHGW